MDKLPFEPYHDYIVDKIEQFGAADEFCETFGLSKNMIFKHRHGVINDRRSPRYGQPIETISFDTADRIVTALDDHVLDIWPGCYDGLSD